MAQDEPRGARSRWQRIPTWQKLLIGVIGVITIVALIVAGYWWPESGFDGQPIDLLHRQEPKQLWDWLELLIVPAVLAVGGLLFSRAERLNERDIAQRRWEQEQDLADKRRAQDQKIADDRRAQEQEIADAALRESTLQLYLDRMSDLLISQQLLNHTTDNSSYK